MKNKYYTPTIDEFHVGFRFEVLNNEIWEWQHMNASRLQEINFDDNTNNMSKYRVRYLDKTDIESLGFKEIIKDQYHFIGFMDGDVMLLIDDGYFIQIINKSPDGKDCYLFQGTVKNKSELVKLLKMLGINE